MTAQVQSNFTIVIVVLVRSTTYADQRISGPGMQIAVKEIRAQYPALRHFQVVVWKDEFLATCDGLEANVVDKASRLYYEKLYSTHPIAAFFGTTCTFGNKQFLDSLYYWNLPLLEGSSMASVIADRERYPMILGFSYTQRRAGEFFYQVVRMFNWSNVVAMYDVEDAVWRAMFTAMDYFNEQPDVELDSVPFYLKSRGRQDVERALRDGHKKARVFLILANPQTVRDIMVAADKLGYARGDHVFIAGEYFKTKFYFGLPKWDDGSANEEVVRNAFRSLFIVKQHIPSSPEFQEFSSHVQAEAIRQFNQSIPPYDEVSTGWVNTHAIGFHDAILSFGQVANEAISEGADIFDGRGMIRRFTNRTFTGIRGNFTLDSDNNLKGHFELWNFNSRSGHFVKVVDFPETARAPAIVSDIIWFTPNGTPPPNEPPCWYLGNNPECRDRTVEQVIGGVLAGTIILAVAGFLFVSLHRRRRYRKYYKKDIRWWDIQSAEMDSVDGKSSEEDIPTTAIVKNDTVSLISITASVLTDEATIELRKLRNTHSDKLLRIIGLCLDRKLMVAEYCARGSLYNFVRSGTSESSMLHDWMFRFSLLSDLAEGLTFIHYSWLHQHGRLKSVTCYLTFRFQLKIGDYCLQSLTPGPSIDLKSSIWTAPEILRGSLFPNNTSALRAADMYSFGIIASEIVWSGDPFVCSGYSCDPTEVVKAVREVRRVPFRPNFEELQGHKSVYIMNELKNVIATCWDETPSKRPAASGANKKIQSIIGARKDGLVEELLERVASYAEDLEKVVGERTRELHDEKIKVQDLLFEILPKTVALELISGKTMVPDHYDSVTVLFSAVENFSIFAAACSPPDLMQMMHLMYTTLDAGLEHFDVYKVESVIDQYLIASGVPIRNKTNHVFEIASCALYLQTASKKINCPDEILRHTANPFPQSIKLLIGFHTGPIMTGVIGTKMPRFCLFGDTVNTASRMASSAIGGMIQFSEVSKAILDERKDFIYKSRGEIAVKGKGIMNTYVLLDHMSLPASHDEVHINSS